MTDDNGHRSAGVASWLPRAAERAVGHYDGEGHIDLPGLAGSISVFGASVATVALALRSGGHRVPERYAVHDLVLGGIAAHKFSRLLTKSSVASPVRAPFTEFEGPAAAGEHAEAPRGDHGARHTIGELLTCPFCLGVWVSGAYVAGLVAAPRPTRTWAAVFVVTAVGDTMQHLYARIQE